MTIAATSISTTKYEAHYDSTKVIQHPEFQTLTEDAPELSDPELNIACAYNLAHEIHMVKKPRFEPGPGEVTIHVRATEICGSGVHFWKHDHTGPTKMSQMSAEQVMNRQAKLVAIEAGVPCGLPSCDPCRTGRYNAYPAAVFFSIPLYHEGSLCEPLAVALVGLDRTGVRLGEPIAIWGAGPIGLVTFLAAHATGCTPIVITDLFPSRLEFAKKLLPTVKTVQIEKTAKPEEVAKQIKDAGGMQLSLAVDCTRMESSIRSAIFSVKFGGKVFVIGVGPSEQSYPFGYCSANEINLQLPYRYNNQYPKAIRLVAGGLVDLKTLVTHRFTLKEAVKAFHVAADPSQGSIKV
ncbi:L-iditol 2-dehydrogenase [Cryptococcus neoformans Gb118]|nr:L-iditol 2-dehydrogenase [Cryptococcus neoformans var. grubii MW-RSA36]OXL07174.1 L-iditol 2-dehydrogenase [Cryptococcus neoformans var. grubii Gb118]